MLRRTLAVVLALGVSAGPPLRLSAQSTDARLQRALDSLTTGFHGTVGIYVRHLKSGRTAGVNADSVFPTASMIKVPILIATFDAMERGAPICTVRSA